MKPTRQPAFQAKLLTAAIAACFSASLQANPVGPAVVNGTASFAQQGSTLTVTNSHGAIINWQGFSIGANETTRFVQPSAASSVLNRVVTQDPSSLLGSLQSNGKVFLINPAGIMVGQGARIDVAGFVASTLQLSDQDFLAGKLNFTATPDAGKLSNAGTITTPTGGSVYLVGPNVDNSGVIHTPQGETILAAGQTVQLIDTSTPGVKVEITGDQNQATNLGQIVAESGRIGIAGVLVKNSGSLNANSVVSDGGRIFLRATKDTVVDGNSQISAKGLKGGQIEVLGNRVAVMDNAQLDVSGTQGGGTVLVGGDYQGKNPDVQNAQVSYFGPQASIKADATDSGNGGKVIVWADDTTRAYGKISARGGMNGGNGGFVETSGKGYLDYRGLTDLRAPHGKAGTLLLDPTDVTIYSGVDQFFGSTFSSPPDIVYGGGQNSWISWSTIVTQLGLGNVAITTSGAATGNGDITVASGSYSYSSNNSLNLWANRHITFQGGGFNNSGTGNINLVAGWDGISSYPAATYTGTVGDVVLNNSYIYTNGALSVKAAGNVKLDATLAGGSSILSSAGASQWIEAANGSVQLLGGVGGQAIIQYYGSGMQTVKGGSISVLANNASSSSNYQSAITSNASQTIQATVGGITLTGGGAASGINNPAYITANGTQQIDSFSAISLTAGAGGQDNGATITNQNGNQTINAPSISMTAGAGGIRNRVTIGHNGTGNQTINLTGSGNVLVMAAGGGAGSYDNQAEIGQWGSSGSQTLNIGNLAAANVVMTGGAGTGMGSTPSSECGAVCTGYVSHNSAGIHNKGSGGQTLQFNVAGSSLTMTGGSGGNENSADISNDQSSGMQNILGNPNITLNGGGSGGMVIRTALEDFHLGNGASIFSEAGGQNITANTITLIGNGTSNSVGGAFIGSPQSTITTLGNVQLNGGAGNGDSATLLDLTAGAVKRYLFATPAAIGEMIGFNGVLNIGGSLTLSGGTISTVTDPLTGLPIGGSPALIGALEGPATITVNAQNSINLGAAANAAYIGSWRELGGTVTLTSGIGGTGAMNLGGGMVGTGSTGSVTLDAQGTGGSISQPTGKIRTGTLTATAKTGISLLGSNQVNSISAISDLGNIGFNNTQSFHVTNMWAKAATGNITLTTIAVPTAAIDVGLGTLTAGTSGTVAVTTTGGMFDDNGSGVTNLKGQAINLISYGSTSPATLAISTDVEATASLTASVGPTATYGDINIRSLGAQPGSITIGSQASSQGNIDFFQSGALSLGAGTSFNSTVGSLALSASGPVTLGSFTPGIVAGQTMNVFTPGDMTVTGNVSSAGDLKLAAANLNMAGGNTLYATYNLYADIAGDMRINESTITAGNTVDLTLNSSTSTLYLNDAAYANPAKINAGSATSPAIKINLPGRATGGIIIDGVETLTTVAGASGFYVSGTPAVQGADLLVNYGLTDNVVANLLAASITSISSDPGLIADTAVLLPATSTSLATTDSTQTIGGTTGTFGEDDNGKAESSDKGKKDDKSKDKKYGQCS